MKRLAGFCSVVAFVFITACAQTDSGITTNVKTKLAADDIVKASQVDVTTHNHVVTLTGEVDTAIEKDQALKIARNTDGVRDVIDQLRVAETAATSGELELDDDVHVEIKDDTGHAIDATKNAAEKAGKATASGAKKVGRKVRDAVTDKDRDSDRDGH